MPARKFSILASRKKRRKICPGMAQHHHERHQRTPRAADIQMAETSAVHLALFTRQAAQPQIRLGRTTRTVAGNEMAKM